MRGLAVKPGELGRTGHLVIFWFQNDFRAFDVFETLDASHLMPLKPLNVAFSACYFPQLTFRGCTKRNFLSKGLCIFWPSHPRGTIPFLMSGNLRLGNKLQLATNLSTSINLLHLASLACHVTSSLLRLLSGLWLSHGPASFVCNEIPWIRNLGCLLKGMVGHPGTSYACRNGVRNCIPCYSMFGHWIAARPAYDMRLVLSHNAKTPLRVQVCESCLHPKGPVHHLWAAGWLEAHSIGRGGSLQALLCRAESESRRFQKPESRWDQKQKYSTYL
jgi:hypothetical protein